MTAAVIIAAAVLGAIIGASIVLLNRASRLERLLEAHERSETDIEAIADATREPVTFTDEQLERLQQEIRKEGEGK